jgi:hypothetical protein
MTSGCVEDNNDDNNIQDYENLILGSWTRNETFENFTYIIDYDFYSNNSFFSGIKDEGEDSYNITIWGSYSIDDNYIEFIVDGENPSTSSNKYSISSDEDLLILYYDDTNFDVLKRKN